jgi:chemotaxis protein methyltransferase CheR
MREGIPEFALSRLAELIARLLGLHYPQDRWSNLAGSVRRAAAAAGFPDAQQYVRWLLESPNTEALIETLARFVTVGETHFFRDEKLFRVLEEQILPELISQRINGGRRLRVWSAGCATGEEPYTVAIIMNKLLVNRAGWNLTILATDVNRASLEKAKAGVYTDWSFRSVASDLRDRYFIKDEDDSIIIDEIKKMVKFDHLNLARDHYPIMSNDTESMDVVFCRNVIMYFTPERQAEVVNKLFNSLNDGGWLIVSPAEASIVQHPQLCSIHHQGAVLFRKEAAGKVFAFADFLIQDSVCHSSPGGFEPEIDALSNPFIPEELKRELAGVQYGADFDSMVTSVVEDYVIPVDPVATPVSENDTLDAYYLQAIQYLEQGRYAQAIDTALEALANGLFRVDRSEMILLLSRAYANLGKLEEALIWAERLVAADKLNADYHYFHGTILQEKGNLNEAVSAMQRAVFLNPKFVLAHFSLGNLALKKGKSKESQKYYRAVSEILSEYDDDEVVPAAEGMTAGKLMNIIQAMTQREKVNGKA